MVEYYPERKSLSELKDELKDNVRFEPKDIPATLSDPEVLPDSHWQKMIKDRKWLLSLTRKHPTR